MDDEFCVRKKYAFNLSTMLRRVTDKVRTHVALVPSIMDRVFSFRFTGISSFRRKIVRFIFVFNFHRECIVKSQYFCSTKKKADLFLYEK